MKKISSLLIVLVLTSGIAFNTATYAVKHVVLVGNFFFNPVNVNVNVGDTIRWVWSAGTHTTTSTPGAIPPGAASWDALITSLVTTFEYKVTVAGTYAYVCTPHAPSMAGTFTAAAVAPTLSVAPSNRNVTAAAGSTTFAVTSNSSWTASSNAAWCTVTPGGTGNGTVTANYAANTTTSQRVATITLNVTGLTPQLVTVTQAASTVGVNEQIFSNLKVYPNPTKGLFKISASDFMDQEVEISILDISGKMILSRICADAEAYTFDLSGQPGGYYFIRVKYENEVYVRRIVLID